ncbi:hypothetical protein IV203_009520 [Nitzschia inconspicua]|uniref:Uncharacterized protein n=1 Tax=Nitzschia inconspicua TaxID=303405 RepID=A0A9K3KVW2_9STRA|nr:hypothetical protein IV203_009520 [Nitzschia inconspicua]
MVADSCYILLSFLDVVTLLRKQVVSKQFNKLCTQTITAKCGKDGPPPLTQTKHWQRQFVNSVPSCMIPIPTKKTWKRLLCKYGYPIDSWNVSQVTDMSKLFCGPFDMDDDIQG